MELIYGENFVYPFPHVTYYLQDLTEQAPATPALPNTCIMPFFILAPEGLDGGFVKFSGGSALQDFDNMFGDITIKEHGLMGEFARKHIQAGGIAIVQRLTADDAALANALVSLEVDETIVTAYIDPEDGKLYNEDTDPTSRTELTIPSYSYNFVTENKVEIQSPAELELVASSVAQTDVIEGDKTILPIFAFNALGKGRWGNNLQTFFNETIKEHDGHRLFKYQLANLKKGTIIDDYDVSHVPDLAKDGVPINLFDTVARYSGKMGMTMFENNYLIFDNVFTEHIDNIITELNALIAGEPVDDLITKLNILKGMVNDPDYGMLDKMELFDNLFEGVSITAYKDGVGDIHATDNPTDPREEIEIAFGDELEILFPNTPISSIRLGEGHDGSLRDMRRFDWTFEDDAGNSVVTDMFADAWGGASNPELMDFTKINGDMVIDLGYPKTVKGAINDIVKLKRQDMGFLMGIPTDSIQNIEQLQSYTSAFNPENNQVCKLGQTTEWRDGGGKIHRIPVTALMYRNFIDHFMNGYSEPVAGQNGYISGIEEGSLLPAVNDADDKTTMTNMNFNYISKNKNGYYLDGQATNHQGGYSKLKEFFNILIKGRIMKFAIPFLESRKHLLDKVANIDDVKDELQQQLNDRFGGKMQKIEAKWLYKNEQEKARGDVTWYIDTYPHGSTKRYRLYHRVLPKE